MIQHEGMLEMISTEVRNSISDFLSALIGYQPVADCEKYSFLCP